MDELPVHADACLLIAVATIEQARKDYRRGPGIGKHYETAEHFLRDAGLLPAGQQRTINKEYIYGYTTIEPRRTGQS